MYVVGDGRADGPISGGAVRARALSVDEMVRRGEAHDDIEARWVRVRRVLCAIRRVGSGTRQSDGAPAATAGSGDIHGRGFARTGEVSVCSREAAFNTGVHCEHRRFVQWRQVRRVAMHAQYSGARNP